MPLGIAVPKCTLLAPREQVGTPSYPEAPCSGTPGCGAPPSRPNPVQSQTKLLHKTPNSEMYPQHDYSKMHPAPKIPRQAEEAALQLPQNKPKTELLHSAPSTKPHSPKTCKKSGAVLDRQGLTVQAGQVRSTCRGLTFLTFSLRDTWL